MRTCWLLVVGLLLAACRADDRPAAGNTVSGNGITLVSDSIDLPVENATLPAGHDLVAENCIACHSVEMLTTQPPLTAETWQATIDKMRTVYKAPIDPENDAGLIEQLTGLPTQMPE